MAPIVLNLVVNDIVLLLEFQIFFQIPPAPYAGVDRSGSAELQLFVSNTGTDCWVGGRGEQFLVQTIVIWALTSFTITRRLSLDFGGLCQLYIRLKYNLIKTWRALLNK